MIVVKRIIQKLLTLSLVAFKFGVEPADWFLNKFLKAMWKIFDDSLARRDTLRFVKQMNFHKGVDSTQFLTSLYLGELWYEIFYQERGAPPNVQTFDRSRN